MEQVKQRKTESLLSSLLKARLESEREREREIGDSKASGLSNWKDSCPPQRSLPGRGGCKQVWGMKIQSCVLHL